MGEDRYELRIERLDGRRLAHDPGPVTVVFDADDDRERETVCGRHFVPLACAAEGSRIYERARDMPFLAEYVLQVWHRNRPRGPMYTSTNVGDFVKASRFD